jgi:DNA-binding MarR family transcriptional regulator
MSKETEHNARLYCMFRDEQFALYDEYMKSKGMLMNTFFVLKALYYANNGLTQKQICEISHNSKQNVSLIIKNLLIEGYVVLSENEEDRRNKIVMLTDKGCTYSKSTVQHIARAEDRAMEQLTEKEQKQLLALSEKFTKLLTECVNGKKETTI